ncbi:hypothetical protein P3G67_34060 [Streptomyces sp. RB6PN23]|uniref:Uncharacterized protein n=1 Tax=Streptomyces silvisoli TaxID=3034235 RepID=A0ABT5ZX16_9ACTN|nr:hypothetical protein [Streptomyces silvisoli]MDF3294145.1 hypothetical protein [Streptomyces silvisoli]
MPAFSNAEPVALPVLFALTGAAAGEREALVGILDTAPHVVAALRGRPSDGGAGVGAAAPCTTEPRSV